MEKQFDYSSTVSVGDSPLTSDILQRAIDLMRHTKRVKVLFSPFVSDGKIFYGKWVDEILQCSEGEEGFLVPENLRESLDEFKGNYHEVLPRDLVMATLRQFQFEPAFK